MIKRPRVLVDAIHDEITKLKDEGQVIEKGSIKIDPEILRVIFREYASSITMSEDIPLFDWSEVSFGNVNVSNMSLEGENIILDPQVIKNKSLYRTNCRGLDMKGKIFTGVCIVGAVLEGTNAKIDPQEIFEKSLYKTNCRGLDMGDADFTGVFIEGANLEGTNAKIDPQVIKDKSLYRTNCRGLDMSDADFTGARIDGANLEGTGAKIYVRDNGRLNICGTNLIGCTIYKEGRATIISDENTVGDLSVIVVDEQEALDNMLDSVQKVFQKMRK